MSVFCVERNKGNTVMRNCQLRGKSLSLKATGIENTLEPGLLCQSPNIHFFNSLLIFAASPGRCAGADGRLIRRIITWYVLPRCRPFLAHKGQEIVPGTTSAIFDPQ